MRVGVRGVLGGGVGCLSHGRYDREQFHIKKNCIMYNRYNQFTQIYKKIPNWYGFVYILGGKQDPCQSHNLQ